MKYNNLLKLIFVSLFIFTPFLLNAQTCPTAGKTPNPTEICNPLGESANELGVSGLIGRGINAALGVVGSLALAMFIYGGFTWMLSGGSSDKTAKGKNIIIWAALGMIIIFSAYAMVNFVLKDALGLGASTTTTTTQSDS